jgi:hypothetical protein
MDSDRRSAQVERLEVVDTGLDDRLNRRNRNWGAHERRDLWISAGAVFAFC